MNGTKVNGGWGRVSQFRSILAFMLSRFDFGIKRNMLRKLAQRGCRITVFPAQTSADEILALQPDGVFLSNGPGDPEPCDYAIAPPGNCLKKKCRFLVFAWDTNCWDWPVAPEP